MNTLNLLAVLGLLALSSPAQSRAGSRPSRPAGPQGVDAARATLLEALRKEGLAIDLKARTITVPAKVIRPPDPLEYLLVHQRGKSHEALLVTKVKASLLNSAFILLGYEKGKNATYKEKKPAPTPEEIQKGAEWVEVFPPKGMSTWITVSWTDAKKKRHELPAEDLILDLRTQKSVRDNSWIYLGGHMAALLRHQPPVFVGDYEGNLVSICYLAPPNHLVTMRHERARDDENWWISELCPPADTKVKVTFHRKMPDLVKQRLARLARAKGKD